MNRSRLAAIKAGYEAILDAERAYIASHHLSLFDEVTKHARFRKEQEVCLTAEAAPDRISSHRVYRVADIGWVKGQIRYDIKDSAGLLASVTEDDLRDATKAPPA